MNTIQTIAKNTGVLAIAQAITMILGLVLIIFIARSIGDADFGKLGFAQSFTALLVIFADMGLSTVTIREIARQKELTSKYLGNIFLIKLILSVVTFALIALIINLMHYPADTTMVVYLIGISFILSSLSALSRSIFRAFEKMEFEAFLNTGKSIVTTGIGLAVLFSGYGLIAIAFVYLLAGIIDLFATVLVTVTKFARPKLEVDFHFWKQIVHLALPFSLTAFIGLIYFQIDIVMLSVMKGDAPVGWYKAACVLVYSLVIIPDILSYSIFPVMSRFYISSRDALKTTLEKSAKYLFIIGLPIAIGTILLSDRIILLFYGEGFSHSIIALQILSLYLPLRFINHATGYTLSSINKELLRALSATIAAGTNVVLNLFLIPKFSFAGAAIATAITEVALFISYYYFVAKHFHRLELHTFFIRPCLACLAMGIFVFYLKSINLALLVITAAIIYLVVLYFVKGFDEEDKAIFKNLKEGIAVGRNFR
jgi:O-antigen/teichoic acid export membrane protein